MELDYYQIEGFIRSYYPGTKQGSKYNQYSATPKEYKFDKESIDEFNKIYQFLLESDLNTITRTPSGGIKKGFLRNNYAWDIKRSSIGARITVIMGGYVYVFKIGAFSTKKDAGVYPSAAFKIFKAECEDNGIDLDTYKIPNGKEVKDTIEAPLILMLNHMSQNDKPLNNVHHIDFHNSYPAGLANTHPEFRPVIEKFYNLRKTDPKYKAVLNYTIGWMQSYNEEKKRYAEWAQLSKDAITDNNNRIMELNMRLITSGRTILGFNTDGIWYQGDIYHGEGEGDKLGEWSNDHINCLFRSKSNGAYEFIENGQYNAVVRGNTSFDAIEPDRSKWTWGDIYKSNVLTYTFDEKIGVVYEEI